MTAGNVAEQAAWRGQDIKARYLAICWAMVSPHNRWHTSFAQLLQPFLSFKSFNKNLFLFFVLFSAMGWGGYGKGGYGWGFPPMMMMPWGKGKGKARLHVFPNDSLVSLLQVACIKTWVLHSFAVSVARDQRSVIVFDCAGAPRLCEREEGVDWRIARRAYQHWDQQEAEGAHGPGRNLSKASRATICCPCWYTRSFMCILVSSDLSKLWTKGTKSSEVTSVASMLWRGHFFSPETCRDMF